MAKKAFTFPLKVLVVFIIIVLFFVVLYLMYNGFLGDLFGITEKITAANIQ